MKMVEIKLRSATAELEKLNARKERAEKALQKAIEKANKLECNWTNEEYRAWMETVETENGFIVNKKDIERNGAFRSLGMAKYEYDSMIKSIEKAEARFEKTQEEADSYHEKAKAEMNAKAYEELMKAEFVQEQKEWAKDGITLEQRYYGTTPNGKRFFIERNHGFTERSLHCFTLTINGDTIFTSGEFWRAYSVIKNA